MANDTTTLYGTTSDSGSVPSAIDAAFATTHTHDMPSTAHAHNTPAAQIPSSGPTYSDEGRLVLTESFANLRELPDPEWFEAGLATLLRGEDLVESWRIWDCAEQRWADFDLVMHRFEMYDLVVRRDEDGRACTWRGALDTRRRVAYSRDEDENDERCWQWLRAPREQMAR